MFVNAQLHKISRAEMKYPEADKATNIIRWVVQGVCGWWAGIGMCYGEVCRHSLLVTRQEPLCLASLSGTMHLMRALSFIS